MPSEKNSDSPKQITRDYSFPEHSITVQATSTEEAEKKLKVALKEQEGAKNDD
jgi:hypothetical protein